MSKWQEVALQDVVTKLGDGLHGTPKYDENGEYYFINGNNLSNGKIIIKESTKKTSAEEYNKHKKELNDRTILVSINGTLGNVALYNGEKCFLGKSACYFNVKEDVDKLFIKYVVTNRHFQKYISIYANGTTIKNVSLKTMREYPFSLPPVEEQKAITAVLASLDDKIDLLHRQNKTLEALAQTFFRHWFIDEAEEFVKLPELVEINPKLSMKKGTVAPYLEMKNVQTDSCAPLGWYDREFKSGTRFQNGDTLMARITPCLENNKVSYVNFLNGDEIGWGSTEYLVLRSRRGLPNFYTYLLAKNPEFRSFAIKTMTGSSGRQRVQTKSLFDYELGIPSNGNLESFKDQISPIAEKLKLNAIQIRTLGELRDTLLPKLMSGEVRVRL